MDTKKILSLLLSIALVFTLMPIGNASFAQQTGAATTIAVTAESQSAIASLRGDKITFVTKEKDAAASEELEVTIANNGRAETQSLTIKLDDAAKNAFELVAVDTETTVALDGLTADTIANGASKKFKIKTKALSEAKEHTGKLTLVSRSRQICDGKRYYEWHFCRNVLAYGAGKQSDGGNGSS